jgi:hypothetical protein
MKDCKPSKPFIITPHKGYLNTCFNIRKSSSNLSQILIDGEGIDSLSDIHLNAGEHVVTCRIDGEIYSDTVFVEDAIRLGGSKIVSGFCFDNSPWIFIVLKDRTYFFNSSTKEHFVENGISPINVTALTCDLMLFANGERNNENDVDIKEYAIFDCSQFCFLGYYHNEVFHNDSVVLFEEGNEDRKEKQIKIVFYEHPGTSKEITCIDYKIQTDGITYCNAQNTGFDIRKYLFESEDEKVLYTSQGKFVCFQNDSLIVEIDSCDHVKVNITDILTAKKTSLLRDNRACIRRVNGKDINEEDPVDLFYQQVSDNRKLSHLLALQLHAVSFNLYNTSEGVYARRMFQDYDELSTNDWLYKNKRVYPYKTYYNLIKIGAEENQILLEPNDEIIETGQYLIIKNDKNIKIVSQGKIIRELENIVLYRTPKGKYYYTQQEKDGLFILGEENGFNCIDNNPNIDCSKLEAYGILKSYNSIVGHYILLADQGGKSFNIVQQLYRDTTIVEKNGRCFGIDSDSDGQEYFIRTDEAFCNHIVKIPVGYQEILSMTTAGSMILARSTRYGAILYEKYHEQSDYVINEIFKDIINTDVFRNALFSDDGQHLITLKNNGWVYHDIKSGEEISFTMDKAIESRQNVGLSGMNYYVRYDDLKRRIDIVDPFTLNLVRPGFLGNYVFVSPSGNYVVDTNREIVKRYYLKYGQDEYKEDVGDYMSEAEKKYDWTFDGWSRGSKDVEQKIIQRLLRVLRKPNQAMHRLITDGFFLYEEWSSKIVIRKLNNGEDVFGGRIIEIEFPNYIYFLNYVAFSLDDRYVSICGMYGNRRRWTDGFVGVYDIEKKEWVLNPDPVYNRAIWRTFFSSNGYFAFYNSEPTTVFCKLEDEKSHEEIDGRNILTFSRSGKYMALSDTHYVPYYNNQDKWGHMHSSNVYVRSVEQVRGELRFSDHGDEIQGVRKQPGIRPQYAICVSFSPDDSKLLSVSQDGVIIIRNLHLEDLH